MNEWAGGPPLDLKITSGSPVDPTDPPHPVSLPGTLWLLLIGFVALGLAPHWPTLKRHAHRLLCALLVLVMLPVHGLERVTYYHHDLYGSPVAATDESGHLLWRERYAPYGARERQEGPARETQAFTGKAEEAALGLQDFGARWYAPGSGRFISPDPLGFVEGNLHSFNRYAYGNNNPYRYVDPDGRNAVTAFGGLLMESYNWLRGRGFDGAMVWGALKDGYDGEGAGFWASAGQDVAYFASGAGAAVLAVRGARAVGAATGGSSLVHMSTKAEDILTAGKLGLPGNIYAGPASNAGHSGLSLTLRTGLTPGRGYGAVPIPAAGNAAFSKVTPIGIVTGWQRFFGHQYTARGIMDLSSGAFTRYGVNWNQLGIYGTDAVIDAGVAAYFGVLRDSQE